MRDPLKAAGVKQPLLVLTSTFPRWKDDSIPSFVYELSRRLAPDFDIHVLTPYAPGSLLHESRSGMQIHRYRHWPGEKCPFAARAIVPTLKMKPWLWLAVPLFFLLQLLHAIRLVRAHSIKVIHAHWIIPQGLTAVLCRLITDRNIRIAITAHGTDVFGLGGLTFLKRCVLNRASVLTVASHAILDRVQEWRVRPSLPIKVLPMGVDLTVFHPAMRDESLRRQFSVKGPFLLFVGRLTEVKGLHYLLQAMPEIVREYPDIKLLIVGDGEERYNLQQLAGTLGLLRAHAVFVGALPHKELPRYMATADIFIGPSISATGGLQEGFGLVFAEAMACHCAVIASDLKGISDIVRAGKTGLTVCEKDPGEIARAVSTLLQNPTLLNKLRTSAYSYVRQKFGWDVIAHDYSQILRIGFESTN